MWKETNCTLIRFVHVETCAQNRLWYSPLLPVKSDATYRNKDHLEKLKAASCWPLSDERSARLPGRGPLLFSHEILWERVRNWLATSAALTVVNERKKKNWDHFIYFSTHHKCYMQPKAANLLLTERRGCFFFFLRNLFTNEWDERGSLSNQLMSANKRQSIADK